MLTAEQKAIRAGRIGSSQIAAVLGLHPHKTPFAAWEDITGRATFTGNVSTGRGNALEDAIARIFEIENPEYYCIEGDTILGKEDWIVDTPDRIICDKFGKCGVLEIKAVGPWNSAGWTQTGVPDHVEMQLRWHMMCADLSVGWAVGFFNIQDVRIIRFERDQSLEEIMLNLGRDWYVKHITTDTPPSREIDASDEAARYVRAHFKKTVTTRELVEGTAEAILFEQLKETSLASKRLVAQEKELRNRLAFALKGDSVSLNGDSFTLQARKVTKWQEIAKSLGAPASLIQEHTRPSLAYTLRVKAETPGADGIDAQD